MTKMIVFKNQVIFGSSSFFLGFEAIANTSIIDKDPILFESLNLFFIIFFIITSILFISILNYYIIEFRKIRLHEKIQKCLIKGA